MRAVLLIGTILVISPAAFVVESPEKPAAKCKVSEKVTRKLIAIDDGVWRPYSKQLAEHGGDVVEVATVRRGQQWLVIIESDTAGDIFRHQELCFDIRGRLLYSEYEVRTAWGWGYRESDKERTFFEIPSGRAIPMPTEPMDGSELTAHERYKTLKDLPFAKFIDSKRA